MSIERLTITSYKDHNFGESDKLDVFEVMLNPTEYTRTLSVEYNQAQGFGTLGSSMKYARSKPETINLDFTFDGTGVIPGQGKKTVKEQLKYFRKVAFDYNSEIHRNNFLELNWGELVFRCVLSKYTVKYTMFNPEGDPLRAKVSATFNEYISAKEEAAEASRESPDLTHKRTVRLGDTLSGLCEQIYNDPSCYLEVARFNRLATFRNLQPGTELIFPQIR